MLTSRPTVSAEATFLLPSDGGRANPPILTEQYRPHIVIQPIETREADIDNDGKGCEEYLGVCFLEGPAEYHQGETIKVTLDLMYFPRVDYRKVQPDATFTIREGGNIVGFGRIVSRHP